MRLENKTAIVTGAGRGLGKGIALKLAAEGAKVIVADMSMETASATAEEINASGGTAKAFAVNIAKQDEVKAMMDFTVESPLRPAAPWRFAWQFRRRSAPPQQRRAERSAP